MTLLSQKVNRKPSGITNMWNKYVAGVDGRLFAWKAGCEKADVATGTWPRDMYEVVRFSDLAHVIASEHTKLAGAKSEALYASLQGQYKGITVKRNVTRQLIHNMHNHNHNHNPKPKPNTNTKPKQATAQAQAQGTSTATVPHASASVVEHRN